MKMNSELDKNFKYTPDNPEAQLEFYVAEAQAGSTEAQAYLAYSAYLGIGTQKDEERGLALLESLCEKESPCAFLLLGRLLYRQKKYEEAYKNFRQANILDNTLAMYELGVCYLSGRGVEQNTDTAKGLFETAILSGDHEEQSRKCLEKLNQPKEKKKNNLAIIGIAAVVLVTVVILIIVGRKKTPDKNKEELSVAQGTEVAPDEVASTISTLADKYMVQFESVYEMDTSTNLSKCYASALAFLSYDTLPVGVPSNKLDSSFTSYAIADVDGDGKLELILINEDEKNLYMSEHICGYDEAKGTLTVEFEGIPYVRCFSKGILKSDTTVTHALSKDFTPYQLYKYEDSEDEYQYFGYIECWDKKTATLDTAGEKFPTAEDKDGDGIIYQTYDSNYNKTIYDGEAFEEFINGVEGEAAEIKLTYTNKLLPE